VTLGKSAVLKAEDSNTPAKGIPQQLSGVSASWSMDDDDISNSTANILLKLEDKMLLAP